MTVAGRELVLEAGSETDPSYQSKSAADDKPFWAYLWPSAIALAEVIGGGPSLEGKRVLDLGCGLGLAGFAAALRGARVLAADIRPEAVALVLRNAAANGLTLEARAVDWDRPPPDLGLFDGILAADVLYDDGMLRGVLRFVRRHLAPEGLALITDPNRVLPGGIQGAARLVGLEPGAVPLHPGTSVGGGVTMFWLRHRGATLRLGGPV